MQITKDLKTQTKIWKDGYNDRTSNELHRKSIG